MPNNQFYKSKAWRKLRSKTVREWRLDNRPCGYCGKPLDFVNRFQLSVDHKISLKRRPDLALSPANLHVVHHTCNSKKAAWEEHSDKPQIGADGFPVGSEWDTEI